MTLLWIALALPLAAAEVRLDYSPSAWRQQVIVPEGANAREAADFSIEPGSITIGPWRTGSFAARLEYVKPMPAAEATVTGSFRTERLYIHDALVRITYNGDGKRISVLNFPLAAPEDWQPFAVPVKAPPPGATEVLVSFGLGEKTEGRVFFRDLRVSPGRITPEFPARPAALVRPRPPRGWKPAPFVRVENAGGAWWLVDASGKPFFSFGSVVRYSKEPGTEPERKVYAILRAMGMNSLAAGHDPARWAAFNDEQMARAEAPVFQFRTLETRVGAGYDTLVDAAGNNPGDSQAKSAARGGFNHAFPDPFDPQWEKHIRDRVQTMAAQFRGKPYFAGWFADNERTHRDLYRYVWSPNAALRFRAFLESRYPSVDALNRAWESKFASYDDLMARKAEPRGRQGAMYEDFRLFSREILKRFNQTVLRIVRELDPGRMVFSNRFMLGEVRDVLENLDLYQDFDAIAVNVYPANLAPGLAPSQRQYLELMHRRTGKPLLITEWSVPARDSGLYSNPARLDWSYPQTVATQQDRARQAATCLAELYNLPYVVGAHWFTWADIDTPQRQANRGLFRANGEPWTELQEAFATVGKAIAAR
jgi:hypothetical protein